MWIAALLAILFGIASLVFFVQLAIHAFRKSTRWGLAVLLLPFAALVYAIKFWSEVRRPFLAWVGTTVASNVMMFAAMGLAAARLASAQAEQFAAQVTAGGPTDDRPRIELEPRAQITVEPEATPPRAPALDPDDVLARLPSSLKTRPADDGFDGYPAPGPIEIASASRYVGSRMRVTGREGLKMTGRLVDADARRLVLEKSLPQGSIEVELPSSDVKTVEFLGP